MLKKLKSNLKFEGLKLNAILPVWNMNMRVGAFKVISIENDNTILLEAIENSFIKMGKVIKAKLTINFTGKVELKYSHIAKVTDRLCK